VSPVRLCVSPKLVRTCSHEKLAVNRTLYHVGGLFVRAEVATGAAAAPSTPDISKALPAIKNVVDQMHLAGPLQFAGPFATANKDDPPHIICLKSTSETRFTVALFFKGDKYDSARMATVADRCDGQTYQPLPN
jgi:hypothetical protein